MAFLAGERITAARLNAELGQRAVKLADKTVNNSSTYSNDVELSIPVDSNSTYLLESFVIYSATTTADFKVNFSGPTGFACQMTPDSLPIGTSGSTDVIDRGVATAASGGVGMGGRGTGVNNRSVARVGGYLTTSTTAGTVAMQVAQLVAEATEAKLWTGSWMKLTKVF